MKQCLLGLLFVLCISPLPIPTGQKLTGTFGRAHLHILPSNSAEGVVAIKKPDSKLAMLMLSIWIIVKKPSFKKLQISRSILHLAVHTPCKTWKFYLPLNLSSYFLTGLGQ